jgi:recombination protein RecA
MAKKKQDEFEYNLVDELSQKFRQEGSNATASFLYDSSSFVNEWISTGSLVLDSVLSNKAEGGIPVGRLTEIAGAEGAGKTLLASYILANTQKQGGIAVFIDSEHAASMEVLEEVGVDLKRLVYVQASTIEDVFRAFDTIIHKIQKGAARDKLITIVWDSVAATSTLAEVEGDYSDHTIGLAARRIGQGLRKLIPIISSHRVACVFINQLRTKIGVMFGDPYDTPGGKAIPYHASIRLRLMHYQALKDKQTKREYGKVIKCQVKKNKVAPPMREVFYHIRWGDRPGAWMDESSTLFDVAQEAGMLQKVTQFKFALVSNPKIEFTKKSWDELLKEPTFYQEIKSAIQDYLIITKDNISGEIDREDVEEMN